MWFWLFVVCVVVFALCDVVRRLEVRWRGLPHFVYNEVGGITAYCSVTDFNRGFTAYGYRVVPATVASGNRPCPVPGRFLSYGDTQLMAWNVSRREKSLFVPFASERCISYAIQSNTFDKPPANVEAFLAAKREANLAADSRMWFLHMASRYDSAITTVMASAVLLALVAGIVGGLSTLKRQDDARANEPAVFYTTTRGSAEAIENRGTQTDIWKLPMTNIFVPDINATITTGPVTDVMAIGGGLDYVCILRESDRYRVCGFAAPGLLKGTAAYLRFGSGKRWVRDDGFDHSEVIRWVITEQEAQALLQKGYKLEK